VSVAGRASILVVDDEPDLRTLYELTLLRDGHDVETAATVSEALALLRARRYQALITDLRLPDGSGMDLLRELDAQARPERAIVITAFGSAESAVEALKAGAFDYLTKPVDLRQFRAVVASALGRSPAAAPRRDGASAGGGGRGAAERGPVARRLVGTSAPMQAVRGMIDKVSRSMAPVLIQGESGTGKELVARAVHDQGARASQPFVAVNCGAIPENLLEAEFFGYRKGAFTGAADDRAGFFQAAEGGTLFLDEIGELPLAMQSKLLRVVQERCVRPIGAVAEVPVNVRLLSATHKDLATEVQAGRFRQDLYYRLNVIQIRVPPLRERAEDLHPISDALLERIARDAGVTPVPRLSNAARESLARYPFPGNVRELENLLHRAVALAGGDEIGSIDLGLADEVPGDTASPPALAAAFSLGEPLPQAGVESILPSDTTPLPDDLVQYLDQVERDVLIRALEQHRFNRTAAGVSLKLSLRQMRYRMARLGIQVGDGGADRGDGIADRGEVE
jgi:two-component system, NtrC family, response regulator PilR